MMILIGLVAGGLTLAGLWGLWGYWRHLDDEREEGQR